MAVIRAKHYREAVDALKKDPIIIAMAKQTSGKSLVESRMVGSDGTPSGRYMVNILNAYVDYGGRVETHIGGPAEAIWALVSEA